MILAWRGVVDEDGDVVAWPTLLLDHNQAFATLGRLRNYRARWRQWEPGGRIDFDPGADPADVQEGQGLDRGAAWAGNVIRRRYIVAVLTASILLGGLIHADAAALTRDPLWLNPVERVAASLFYAARYWPAACQPVPGDRSPIRPPTMPETSSEGTS